MTSQLSMLAALPLLAAACYFFFSIYVVVQKGRKEVSKKHLWLFPAALSLCFLAFSLRAVFNEGVFGFWPEHTRNIWGNQIWFDLLLAVGVGWCFAVPKARALGMRLWPWWLFILCTGSIGLLAMVARIFYLNARAPHSEHTW